MALSGAQMMLFSAHSDYCDNSFLQLPEKLTFCCYLLGIMSCLSPDIRTQGESRQSSAMAQAPQLDIQQADSSCSMAACSTICWLTPPLLWGFILLDTVRNADRAKLLPNHKRESSLAMEKSELWHAAFIALWDGIVSNHQTLDGASYQVLLTSSKYKACLNALIPPNFHFCFWNHFFLSTSALVTLNMLADCLYDGWELY